MFISSGVYDQKLQKIAHNITPNPQIYNVPSSFNQLSSTYNPLMPIKQKTYNDYIMENTQIKQTQNLEPRPYVPIVRKYPQNPVIERVFRPSVVDGLISKQKNLIEQTNNIDPLGVTRTTSKLFSLPPLNNINNSAANVDIGNLPNERKNSKESKKRETTELSVKNSTPEDHKKRSKHSHFRKKSSSYHESNIVQNSQIMPNFQGNQSFMGPITNLNSNIPLPPFNYNNNLITQNANPYASSYDNLNPYGSSFNNNMNTPSYYNNNLNPYNQNIMTPFDYNNLNNSNNNYLSKSWGDNGRSENEEKIMELLLEYDEKKKKNRIKSKNEEYNRMLQKMMKKQSNLLNKLSEARKEKERKRDEINNEQLKHKINYLESQMMFKKFEADQMNFLIDLKSEIKNKLKERAATGITTVDPNLQKNMIFNAATAMSLPPLMPGTNLGILPNFMDI